MIINKKTLNNPSYFRIFNYGGGMGDKTREIIYAYLNPNTPILLNYFYLNNKIPHSFQSEKFDNILDFNSIADKYNEIAKDLIKEGYIYEKIKQINHNFENNIFLLDSGASNIVNYLAEKTDYDFNKFIKELYNEIIQYYDFAHKLKFDFVVSFDLGGKYTFKDNEKTNEKLNDFLDKINRLDLNYKLIDCTINYLSTQKNYYPKVLCALHGKTPEEYKCFTNKVIDLEKQKNYQFFGYALGGIANANSIHNSWFNNIDFKKINNLDKKTSKSIILSAKAIKIVRNIINKEKYIHALGCGGILKIPLNYYLGANSFDAATPARRVGDGNAESTKYVYDSSSMHSFSKMLINNNSILLYEKINKIIDCYPLCKCNSCNNINCFKDIKDLYYSYSNNNKEGFYYAKQLMANHSISQHNFLCSEIMKYSNISDFIDCNPFPQFKDLKYIYDNI